MWRIGDSSVFIRKVSENVRTLFSFTLMFVVSVSAALCVVSLRLRRRYYFNYDHKTREEALSYCREKHTDLATITSVDDVNALRAMADLGKMLQLDFSFVSSLKYFFRHQSSLMDI